MIVRSLVLFVFLVMALVTTGCSTLSDVVNKIQEKSPPAIAKAVDSYCATTGPSKERRKSLVAAVNAHTEKGDLIALDCDQDGKPDF